MPRNNAANFKANGTIGPSRFCTQDTSGDHLVVQSGSGDAPVGISQVAMLNPPGLAGSDITIAATVGLPIQVFSVGDVCALSTGGAGWTRGDYLKPDSNGQGVTASSGNVVGAIAVESCPATAGATALVQVLEKGSKMP